MLAIQAMLTLSLSAAAVLAPAVAPTLGYAPESVGLFAGLAYLVAMLSGLRSGAWIARHGALRSSQMALLVSGSGALLAAAAPAQALLLAAALIGAGYGVVNPAAAGVLTHHAPSSARGLFFSAKQTGVPIGVALAGLLMPLGLAQLGWRLSAAALAAGCAALALALWPLGRRLEPPGSAAPTGGSWGLLRRVWATRDLRALSLASLAFAATQQAFITFVVALLKLELGWTLAAAAGVLAASQAVSALARIFFGVLGDRWVPPGRLLVALGLAMAAACVLLSALRPGVATGIVLLATMACAALTMGWNGVLFAEMSHRVSRAELTRVSGATQFFTFGGGMLGPLFFGEFVRSGAGHALAFAAIATVPALAAVGLIRAGLNGPRRTPA